VLRESPAVAEGVGDLPVAFAPEGLGERLPHLRAGLERTLPEIVDVLGAKV